MGRDAGMIMIGRNAGLVMVMRCSVAVRMGMMRRLTASRAIADVARQRIGEMGVVMGVIQTIHQRNVGLPGQHEGERHAKHGDGMSNRGKSSPSHMGLWLRPKGRLPGNLAQLGASAIGPKPAQPPSRR